MYGSLVFTNEKRRQEWENLDEGIKKEIVNNLHTTCDKMELKISIEVLCNVIGDLMARIEVLEKKSGI